MRIVQINTTVNSGSTGRIAEDIGRVLMANGHESYIAHDRGGNSSSELIKIGVKKDFILHGIKSALFDRHGFGSKAATKALVKELDKIKPDAIGLHNVHGYYLNIEVLFDYIAAKRIPILWTLHDCWAFTGHCAYFDSANCYKWETQCYCCPKTRKYPASYGPDNSRKNYIDKKRIFNKAGKGVIITPSEWLKENVERSFLNYPVQKIHNGIDMELFRPQADTDAIREKYSIKGSNILLGVANIWDKRKGMEDFFELKALNRSREIVLVGLTDKQIKDLPEGIIGIKRTESIQELMALYSLADVFVNPTYQDNFPTTNIEALACGTPVVTYSTGGSPEAVDDSTGMVAEKGDLKGLNDAIDAILAKGKTNYTGLCRQRAENFFDKKDRYYDYLKVYENLVSNTAVTNQSF